LPVYLRVISSGQCRKSPGALDWSQMPTSRGRR